MRAFFALLVILSVQSALAGIIREPVVVSEAVLQAKGVLVSKTLQQGAIPSVTVEVTIGPASDDETFEALEFVVHGSDFSAESLPDIDSYGYDKAARRERRSKREATFDAFGKEVGRAYLVFEFLVPDKSPMAHYRRYLLPVSEIHEKKG